MLFPETVVTWSLMTSHASGGAKTYANQSIRGLRDATATNVASNDFFTID